MSAERRKHARKPLREGEDANPGIFYIEDKKKAYKVKDLRDISLSGAGARLMKSFKEGDQVHFKFESADNVIDIPSTIIWCERKPGTRACNLGLRFDPSDKASNILLFMTLRKYIDFSSDTTTS